MTNKFIIKKTLEISKKKQIEICFFQKKRVDTMKLVICVIIDRDLNALLLVEQNQGRGYWFPYDDLKSDETRASAAKRIANKVYIFSYFSIFINRFILD